MNISLRENTYRLNLLVTEIADAERYDIIHHVVNGVESWEDAQALQEACGIEKMVYLDKLWFPNDLGIPFQKLPWHRIQEFAGIPTLWCCAIDEAGIYCFEDAWDYEHKTVTSNTPRDERLHLTSVLGASGYYPEQYL